jgi:hypothetical protein
LKAGKRMKLSSKHTHLRRPTDLGYRFCFVERLQCRSTLRDSAEQPDPPPVLLRCIFAGPMEF